MFGKLQNYVQQSSSVRPAPTPASDFERAGEEAAGGASGTFLKETWKQYPVAFLVFATVSVLNFFLIDLIGAPAIALVYLLSIVLLALFVRRGPIIFGTTLTA